MSSSNNSNYIDLLRHGDVQGGPCFRGSQNDALSELGWSQMQSSLKATQPWKTLISSPLIRCLDFAKTIKAQYNISLTINPSFVEMHFGEWEGKTAEDITAQDPDALKNFWLDPNKHAPINSEKLHSFKSRVLDSWFALTKDQNSHPSLLICHAGVIRVILAAILNIPDNHMLNIEIPYACLTRIRINYYNNKVDSTSLVFHNGTI